MWPRSETPTAPRTPKPRSVKFRPLRTVRPMPSYGAHWMNSVSTPPCRMKSSSRWPTSLSTKAVTTAVAQAEAAAQAAGDVVFAAAFPGGELAGGADAALAGIEAEHDFAERDDVVAALGGGADRSSVIGASCGRSAGLGRRRGRRARRPAAVELGRSPAKSPAADARRAGTIQRAADGGDGRQREVVVQVRRADAAGRARTARRANGAGERRDRRRRRRRCRPGRTSRWSRPSSSAAMISVAVTAPGSAGTPCSLAALDDRAAEARARR